MEWDQNNDTTFMMSLTHLLNISKYFFNLNKVTRYIKLMLKWREQQKLPIQPHFGQYLLGRPLSIAWAPVPCYCSSDYNSAQVSMTIVHWIIQTNYAENCHFGPQSPEWSWQTMADAWLKTPNPNILGDQSRSTAGFTPLDGAPIAI